ncbi:MAG: nuclear transport factor 2 family protein [Cyclobacteriaceae bacterium]
MSNFKDNNERLNQLLEQGKAMDAFELFYAENVTMQENETEPRLGKDFNREQCGGFVATFPDLKLQVMSVAYGEDLSIQEVLFDYTNEEGRKIVYPEIVVRHWENGLVIQEKFYYNG